MSDNSLAPALSDIDNKAKIKFDGSCLKQDKITFTHEKIVNIYIVYEISFSTRGYDDYPVLENYLFGAVKLEKMLILISTNILDIVFHLIDVELCHLLMVDLAQM